MHILLILIFVGIVGWAFIKVFSARALAATVLVLAMIPVVSFVGAATYYIVFERPAKMAQQP